MAYDFKNILIIKPSSLGDIVFALPALAALRRAYPDAKISWLVRSEYVPLLRDHPYLNEIIIFERELLGKCWYKWSSFKALVLLIKQLRCGGFDAAVDFQGLFRTGLFAFLSGAKHRFGMRRAKEFAWLFYNHRTGQSMENVHLVDYYLKITRQMTGVLGPPEFVFPQNSQAQENVSELLAQNGVGENNYVVIVPGSARKSKQWPAERFGALADRVYEQFGLSIITVGTGKESALTAKVQAASGSPIIDFAGRTSIEELVALLRGARLVISNDTGPGHIAAAMDVPVVLIFGPTNPARVCAYKKPESVVAVEAHHRGLDSDSYDSCHRIGLINVNEVFKRVVRQLDSKSPTSPHQRK